MGFSFYGVGFLLTKGGTALFDLCFELVVCSHVAGLLDLGRARLPNIGQGFGRLAPLCLLNPAIREVSVVRRLVVELQSFAAVRVEVVNGLLQPVSLGPELV